MMRKSVFNGSFYPALATNIRAFVDASLSSARVPGIAENAVAYVAPHAGYIYSGKTAGYTYKAMQSNKRMETVCTAIIIGPNHTGRGKSISVSLEDWETPLGIAQNDTELSESIVDNSKYVSDDEQAHEGEHSIEVQLPFMQCIFPKMRYSFICMGDQSTEASNILFGSIIKSVAELKRNAFIIASSDFNHYESAETANRKDSKLLDAAKILDCGRFNRLVCELGDSACGFGPITVAMMFAKHMKARKGIVLKYSNSGEQTGDYSSVVAYSSIAFV